MIHLTSDSKFNEGLCGMENGPGNLCTTEIPHTNNDWEKVCNKCEEIYFIILNNKNAMRAKRAKQFADRSFKQKLDDEMERLAYWDEGSRPDFYLIPYVGLAICTLGLSIPVLAVGKVLAKYYLKVVK